MAASEAALTIPPAEAWWRDSFMVTFSFTCNLACTFCMVEDALDVYPGTSLETFERVVAKEPERLRGVKRIIFSGGEVTLSDELLGYVRVARSIPGVEHVRLQTNATRLVRRDVLGALRDAGVDEYFVSLHAHDDALCDALTRRKGSFRAIMAGLEAIAQSGATWITNTAIVQPNYNHLADVVELVAPMRPRSMEFWNYWPRGDEAGARALTARVADVRPHLVQALRACIARGIPPTVKWFPRCLLGDLAWCQDDGQPPALIEEAYWDREPEYACLFEGVCADREPVCSGLSFPYIERFGWEETLLSPRRTVPPGTERGAVHRSLLQDPAPARADSAVVAAWLARLGVSRDETFAGFRLGACARTADHREVRLRFEARGKRPVDIFVRAHDASRPSSLRTASFDLLTHRPEPGREREAIDVSRAVARAIGAADPGGLDLPT